MTSRDKVGTNRDNGRTSRVKQGQAGPGRDKLGQEEFPVLACPLLALLVIACSFHCSFISQHCPCLFLLIPFSSLVPGFVWHYQQLASAFTHCPSTTTILVPYNFYLIFLKVDHIVAHKVELICLIVKVVVLFNVIINYLGSNICN